MSRYKLNKMGKVRGNTVFNYDKSALTYGDYWLPPYGAIQNRNLNFPNARLNQQTIPLISVKNIINPRIPDPKNSFGKIWYPTMFIDSNYNPESGGYINANGPIGPYFAQGLGNYPRTMFKEVNFGKKKVKIPSPRRKVKVPKSQKKSKVVYCLPKEQKFPVNTKKKCSAALSYARYSTDPCKIARCVQRNCKKYPTVGSHSTLIEECKKKKKRSSKK
uniref:Uncharacterized protein n=1 Tax=viral metagenome TaxID=1070528 RepID=A0A6C0LEK7_9ZZZZ